MTKKYNVLFFFTDDQRFDTINALGNNEIQTPNIDQLVREGLTFTQAHIPGGTIGAVCMPSRAMLHTGKTLFHLEKNGQTIPENHVLLGETLKNAGYRTFGTGKWHNGTNAYARSFTDGAEIFFGGMDDHWNVPAYHYDPTGCYEKSVQKVYNPIYSNKVSKNKCDHVTPGKHSSELFCEAACNWLHNCRDDKPFFMYVSFMAPHDPRTMPDEYLNMYDPKEITIPENYYAMHPFEYGVGQIRDELLCAYPRTEDDVRLHIAEYYGMISHLDNELGKVIQSLKDIGKYDETIIVFAADNGLAVGQHGLMGKQSCYEHSIRVPLIFSGPDIPINEKRDAYVYLLDIYPTLCDFLGLEKPDSVEGISFIEMFENDKANTRDGLYFTYANLIRAFKNDRFKLIEYRNVEFSKTQLFDLHKDPYELNDLIDIPEYQIVADKLKQGMQKNALEWDDEQHVTGELFWNCY